MGTPATLSDPVQEGLRLIAEARARNLAIFLLGGVAIRARTSHPLFERRFNDIDLIATRSAGRDVTRLMAELEYVADHEFNAVNGRTRLLFRDAHNGRDLDVLVGEFAMCHNLPILECADIDEPTVPLGDLLLTKLQVVELNYKDLVDIYNLLYGHQTSVEEPEGHSIDLERVGRLCASDWGLWRTVASNLDRLVASEHWESIGVHERATIAQRLTHLRTAIARAPKSLRWRLRSRVGDRVQWYEEPEEAH
jgi:hypothetical protein